MLEQDLQGFAPSHTRLREMAARIIDQNYDTKLLGKSWVSGYLQRNPYIKSLVGQPIEAARAKGAQPKQIQEFYDLLQRVQKASDVQVENS